MIGTLRFHFKNDQQLQHCCLLYCNILFPIFWKWFKLCVMCQKLRRKPICFDEQTTDGQPPLHFDYILHFTLSRERYYFFYGHTMFDFKACALLTLFIRPFFLLNFFQMEIRPKRKLIGVL